MKLDISKLRIYVILIGWFSFISLDICFSQAPERDLDVYPYWKYYSHTSNTLYETIAEIAFDQLDDRKRVIESLKSKEEWLERQRFVKSTLEDIVGPFPARTPLNPVVTDTMETEGMVIEKLYFESRPGYYVTAIFCYPANATGPLPAILFCSGHSPTGFRSDTYQHMIFNYVKKGFAVLAFDPIGQGERKRYFDKEGKSRLGPTKEHSYPGSQAFLAGISPANFFIWDGIRAVDYLLTRDEVDAARIGITGRSGGGTQTAYIAAMDERIWAAAPECYITTFDKLLKSNGPQDAEQNLFHGIAKGIDMADYIEVRAPKPTLIVSTTRDIFSIQGVRDTYQEALKAYQALGEGSRLHKVEDDAPHASTVSNREATYAFFQKYLENPGESMDQEVTIFDPEELWVLPSGNVYEDLGGEDIYSLTRKYLMHQDMYRPATVADLRQQMIELSGYNVEMEEPEVIFSGRTQYDDFTLEKYLVQGSGDYYLPVVWMRSHQPSGKVVLLLDEDGKNEAGKIGGPADNWLQAGYSVVIPDLSGIGELGGGYPGGDARIQGVPLNIWYAGILTAKSVAAIHGEEISLLRKFIYNKADKPVQLTMMARGTVGPELLNVTFMEEWKEPVVLIESLVGYRSILEDREYDARYLMSAIPGGLQYFDIKDIVEAIGKDKVLIVDPVDGDGKPYHGESPETAHFTETGKHAFEIIKSWLE